MLPLANVAVIGFTIVGTMTCHLICSTVYKGTWRKYRTMTVVEQCKVDRYCGTAIAAVMCFVFALKAFMFDPDFHQLTLVGSSAAGNVVLDIVIGVFLSDFLYEKMVDGTFGSIRNVGFHLAAIGSSAVGYYFFHRLFLYRIIHHISLPLVIICDLMTKLKCDTSSRLFRCVMQVNLFIFFLSRVVVIPFHWAWYIYEIVIWRDEWPEIWLLVWIALVASSVVTDYINCIWAKGLMKNYREAMARRQ